MLWQIANYCPVISRNILVKNSTSIQSVWNMIRAHFGFQITGAHFLDFANLRLEAAERPEDLFQRFMAFVEDTLLHANSLSHHGEVTTEDGKLTPTLENFIVLTWLKLIHPDLPKLVKQRYETELRSRTLASIKPEISQALTSLLNKYVQLTTPRLCAPLLVTIVNLLAAELRRKNKAIKTKYILFCHEMTPLKCLSTFVGLAFKVLKDKTVSITFKTHNYIILTLEKNHMISVTKIILLHRYHSSYC